MAVTWNKKLVQMRHARALPPNENSVSYTYRCWVSATAGESTTWDPFTYALNVEDDLGLPRPGDLVSDWDTAQAGSWADYFRFRTTDWVSVNDANDVWDVTLVATSREVWCPEPNILRNDQVTFRRVELYREQDPTAASDAGSALAASGYADTEGKPRHRDIMQVKIELQLVLNTAYPPAGYSGYPNMANADNFLGKRNDAAWLGFPLGSVLVDGISVVPDRDEYIRLTYSLVYDPWFHMEQRPELDVDQNPEVNTSGNADPVNWYQPYPDTCDLSQAFGAYENKWIQDGWQAWASPGVACATELASSTAPTATKKSSPRTSTSP